MAPFSYTLAQQFKDKNIIVNLYLGYDAQSSGVDLRCYRFDICLLKDFDEGISPVIIDEISKAVQRFGLNENAVFDIQCDVCTHNDVRDFIYYPNGVIHVTNSHQRIASTNLSVYSMAPVKRGLYRSKWIYVGA